LLAKCVNTRRQMDVIFILGGGGVYGTVMRLPHNIIEKYYRSDGKSLARPGRKQATATEDFDFHISYLIS